MKLDTQEGQAEFATRAKALIEEFAGRYSCGAIIATNTQGQPLAMSVINTDAEGGVAIALTVLDICKSMYDHPEGVISIPEVVTN